MQKRKPRTQKLSGIERAALACFLAAFLASLGMLAYSQIMILESLVWQFLLTSLISMMAGFLYGANRTK